MRKNIEYITAVAGLYIVLLISVSACMERTIPKSIKNVIVEIQEQYAPDRRVAFFDVKSYARNDTVFLEGETSLPEAYAALMQKLDEQGVTYIDEIRLLPDPSLPSRGVVNVSVANIRSNPKHSGELATQALLGMGLKILKEEGDWSYVQTPDGYLGWLDRGGFTLMDDQTFHNWIVSKKVIFLENYGIVRDAPGVQAGPVGDLVAGNILLDDGIEGEYQKVVYPDGRKGYVDKGLVKGQAEWLADHRSPTVPEIATTALQFIGRPYLWGGTSGKGMDCSGFTKTVYFLNGIVLPRDASQQVHAGVEVPTDSTLSGLEPGDFLFFGERTSEQEEKVRHVGIYLGSGQFIHSGADNPGVRIESLLPDHPNFAAHRRKTFLRARRMEIGSPGVTSLEALPEFFGPLAVHQLTQ